MSHAVLQSGASRWVVFGRVLKRAKLNGAQVFTGARVGRLRQRALTRLRKSESGQSMVEFAVSLPVLLLVVTGMFTFGWALNNYLELEDAVSIGARLLAVSRLETTDPCALAYTAVTDAAPFLLRQGAISLTTTMFDATGTQLGSYSGTSCSSGSNTEGAAGNLVQGGSVQVTATFPCNLSVYGVNYISNCNLQAQTTEYVQ